MSGLPPVQAGGPPPGSEERFMRMLKARADALTKPKLDDRGRTLIEGMDELSATKTAVQSFSGFVAGNPDQKPALMDFLEGRTDQMPQGWIPDATPLPSLETIHEENSVEAMRKARAASPWMAAAKDAANVVGGFAEGRIQGAADIATGALNLIPGVDIPSVNVKAALRAAAQSVVPWGTPMSYDEAVQEQQSFEGTANLGVKIGAGVGKMAGNVKSMVGGKVVGMPFRVGAGVGGKLGQTLFGQLGGKIGAAAGGFGLSKAVSSSREIDEATGEERKATGKERLSSLGWGALEGAAIGSLGEVGKIAFRKIMKTPLAKLGVNEKSAVKALQGWAQANKLYPASRESADAYSRRILNEWIDSGMPGAPRFTAQEIMGRAAQGGIEGLGFTALDLHMRKGLLQAALDGDKDAWAKIGESFAVNALGTMALHMPLKDIPSWQRRQDVRPTGQEPKPEAPKPEPVAQEPVKEAAPTEPPVDLRPNFPPEAGGAMEAGRASGDVLPRTAQQQAQFDLFRKAHFDRHGWAPGRDWGTTYDNIVRLGWRPYDRARIEREGVPQLTYEEPIKGFDPSVTEAEKAALPRQEGGGMEIPGTGMRFEVEGDVAKPSAELREVLGVGESVPVKEFAEAVERVSLGSALKSKEILPGEEISAQPLIKATQDGTARTIQFGEVMEAPLGPDMVWKPAESIPARGRDPLPPEQADIVEAMTAVVNGRDDLAPADRTLLSQVADAMDAVSAVKDRSVAETMLAIDPFMGEIIRGTPENAGKAIKAVAEMLTTKAPEVVMKEIQQERVEQAEAKQQAEQVVTFGKLGTYQGRREMNVRGPGEVGEQQSAEIRETAKKSNLYDVDLEAGWETSDFIGSQKVARKKMERIAEGVTLREAKRIAEERLKPPAEPKSQYSTPIPPEVIEAAKIGARGGASWARDAWDYVQRSYSQRVEDAGLKDEAEIFRAGAREQQKNRGRLEAAGAYDMKRAPTADVREAEQLVSDGFGGHTTLYGALMDKGLGEHFKHDLQPSEGVQKLVKLGHAVFLEAGRLAEETGVRISGDKKFSVDPERYRLTRQFTPEGIQMLNDQSGPVWDAWVAWHEKALGMTKEQVQKQWTEARGVSTKDATEFLRKQPVVATRLTVGNRIVKILEDTPREHTEGLIHKSSHVMAARKVLPRKEAKEGEEQAPDEPNAERLPVEAQTFLNRIYNTPGQREAAPVVADALRLMYGMSVRNEPSWWGKPGTPKYHLAKTISLVMGTLKASALSLSAIRNVAEPMANASHFGAKTIVDGYKEVYDSFSSGNIRDLHKRLVEEGWLADSKENYPAREGTLMEQFEVDVQRLNSLLLTPLRVSQNFNELVIASAAMKRLDAMRTGEGTKADRSALKLLGFDEATTESMLRGDGTPEQYDRYKSIVGVLAGGKSAHGLDKSQAAHSRGFNSLVWFTGFFQTRMKLIDSLVRDAWEAPTKEARGQSLQQLAKVAAFTMATGALGDLLMKFFRNGAPGVADYLRENVSGEDAGETTGNVATWGLQLLTSGILGGLGTPIVNALTTDDAKNKRTADWIGDIIPQVVAPIQAGGKIVDLIAALGGAQVPGYEGKGPVAALAQYFRSTTPILKAAHEGLFGIGALSLSDKDPTLAAAKRSYNRWGVKNGIFDESRGDAEDAKFQNSMRKLVDLVDAGEEYGDDAFMDALIDAQDEWIDREAAKEDGKPVSMKDARNAVAKSLRARKKLANPKVEKRRESLESWLGAEHLQTLEDYDLVLEMMAKRIAPPSRR